MKTITTTQSNVTAVLADDSARELHLIEKDLLIEGEKVSIRKGAVLSPVDIASFIENRLNAGATMGIQARYAFYSAGQLAEGEAIQTAILAKLKESLSQTAINQMKSEALTLIPRKLANGFASPVSLLKDAVSVLKFDEAGKLAPMKDQSPIGKKLIPSLKSGTITQQGIRKLRAEFAPKKAPAGPAAPVTGTAASMTDADKALAGMIASLQNAAKVLPSLRPEGEDKAALVNLVTDLGRQLGLQVSVAGK